MDLSSYDNDRAIEALLLVGSDPQEDNMIVSSCGESLAEIWAHRNSFNQYFYEKLTPAARREAYDYIKIDKPEWIKQFKLIR